MHEEHGHEHEERGYEKRLGWAIGVTLIVCAGEIVGGLLSNSLALLSDAGHVFTDVFALGLSLIALRIAERPSNYRATYGYQRIGLLAALANGCSLVLISIFIFIEAYRRFFVPAEINPGMMLVVAVAGLVGNIVMIRILGHDRSNLNMKSAWLHVVGDALTSVGVIVAAVVIRLTGWYLIDPIISTAVGLVIIFGSWSVIKETLWVFLELSPLGFHAEEISKTICGMKNVQGVHDVHIWSIGHGVPAFSAHVLVSDRKVSETDSIRKEVEDMLEGLGIRHTVLQMECAECAENALYCQISPSEEDHHHH
ncbi:MAG TPA: cation diffusion facilitator family transporter [Desulfomonilaceae bacterium]|nr:cation diffusion facilitator family transporter [Desulfomonilaceae bacterium]